MSGVVSFFLGVGCELPLVQHGGNKLPIGKVAKAFKINTSDFCEAALGSSRAEMVARFSLTQGFPLPGIKWFNGTEIRLARI